MHGDFMIQLLRLESSQWHWQVVFMTTDIKIAEDIAETRSEALDDAIRVIQSKQKDTK